MQIDTHKEKNTARMRRDNTRKSCKHLQSVIAAAFPKNAVYYAVRLDLHRFRLSDEMIKRDVSADIIRKLRPSVRDALQLHYVYALEYPNKAMPPVLHLLINAPQASVIEVLQGFWLFDSLLCSRSLAEIGAQQAANAFTIQLYGMEGCRVKRMYTTSKGLRNAAA